MNFLSIYKIEEMPYIVSDGLIGLSCAIGNVGRKTGKPVHLFINELKNDKIIDEAIFAIYLDDTYH